MTCLHCSANFIQLSQYSTPHISAKIEATPAPVIPDPEAAGEQNLAHQEPQPPMSDAPAVSIPQVPEGHSIISKEEKIEYRDQDGNLLNEEQVKALQGKVSFKTRYETRTRMVDAYGNEIQAPLAAGVAPPHPDIDNVDRETLGVPDSGAKDLHASQSTDDENVDKSKSRVAKPASEGNEATAGILS